MTPSSSNRKEEEELEELVSDPRSSETRVIGAICEDVQRGRLLSIDELEDHFSLQFSFIL